MRNAAAGDSIAPVPASLPARSTPSVRWRSRSPSRCHCVFEEAVRRMTATVQPPGEFCADFW